MSRWARRILCRLFGHKPAVYGEIRERVVRHKSSWRNIKRKDVFGYSILCERCGKRLAPFQRDYPILTLKKVCKNDYFFAKNLQD